jgi:hypothetical protein
MKSKIEAKRKNKIAEIKLFLNKPRKQRKPKKREIKVKKLG